MRIRAGWAAIVLGAAWFLAGGAPEVRAADPAPVPVPVLAAPAAATVPVAGTTEEERDYADREAESPEAREFVGGDGLVAVVVVIGIFVIVYLLLKKEGQI